MIIVTHSIEVFVVGQLDHFALVNDKIVLIGKRDNYEATLEITLQLAYDKAGILLQMQGEAMGRVKYFNRLLDGQTVKKLVKAIKGVNVTQV